MDTYGFNFENLSNELVNYQMLIIQSNDAGKVKDADFNYLLDRIGDCRSLLKQNEKATNDMDSLILKIMQQFSSVRKESADIIHVIQTEYNQLLNKYVPLHQKAEQQLKFNDETTDMLTAKVNFLKQNVQQLTRNSETEIKQQKENAKLVSGLTGLLEQHFEAPKPDLAQQFNNRMEGNFQSYEKQKQQLTEQLGSEDQRLEQL